MEEQQWMARAIGAENAEERLQAAFREMSERKEYFRQIWEVAESELAALRTPCRWHENDKGDFDTGCGEEFFYCGKFCPECGHPVTVAVSE